MRRTAAAQEPGARYKGNFLRAGWVCSGRSSHTGPGTFFAVCRLSEDVDTRENRSRICN